MEQVTFHFELVYEEDILILMLINTSNPTEIVIDPAPTHATFILFLGLLFLALGFFWPEGMIAYMAKDFAGSPVSEQIVRVGIFILSVLLMALGGAMLSMKLGGLKITAKGFSQNSISNCKRNKTFLWSEARDFAVSSLPYMNNIVTFNLLPEYFRRNPDQKPGRENPLFNSDRILSVPGTSGKQLIALLEACKARFTGKDIRSGSLKEIAVDFLNNKTNIELNESTANAKFKKIRSICFYTWIISGLAGAATGAALALSHEQTNSQYNKTTGALLLLLVLSFLGTFPTWYILKKVRDSKIGVSIAWLSIACCLVSVPLCLMGFYVNEKLIMVAIIFPLIPVMGMRLVTWF